MIRLIVAILAYDLRVSFISRTAIHRKMKIARDVTEHSLRTYTKGRQNLVFLEKVIGKIVKNYENFSARAKSTS